MKRTVALAHARSGFTLVEMMIALSILSLVFLTANMLSSTGAGVASSSTVRGDLDVQSLRALDRVSSELSRADSDTFLPPAPDDGTSELAFQQVIGYLDGEPEWGNVLQLAFEYAPGELNDGLDNNGDGLVDEGMVVLRRDVGEPEESRVILCKKVRELAEGELANGVDDNGNGLVDEPGFSLQWQDGVMRVRLTLEDEDGEGIEVIRSLETAVRTRNGS